jgi:hypothetical protein
VSAVLWPLNACTSLPAHPPPHETSASLSEGKHPPQPVLWGDWPRCQLRRQWMRLLRTQTVTLTFRLLPSEENMPLSPPDVQTRAQRAHWRLSWQQRLARNARPALAPLLTITIYGLPVSFAQYLGIGPMTAA